MADMRYEHLPNGERIPVLGYGTWRLGGGMAPNYSRDREIVDLLHEAIELGYTHIDTAEIYGGGHTEELIGRAIQHYDRQDLFITTKVWHTNLRLQDVLDSLKGSLRRLSSDYVDLYLIHWPNSGIPMEETFEALNELIDQGQIRFVGVSNFDLEQLTRARALSAAPIATNQVPYNLHNRRYVLNGVLKYCQENDILLTAYSPIDRGVILDDPEVSKIANKYQATSAQVALNWLIRQSEVIAIPMTSNPKHLRDNIGALEIELEEEDVKRLDDIG
jgi:diketogulonate reductase-like aldo/keto reductase